MVIGQCDAILNKYNNAMLFNEENFRKYFKSFRKVGIHDIFLNFQLVFLYFSVFMESFEARVSELTNRPNGG